MTTKMQFILSPIGVLLAALLGGNLVAEGQAGKEEGDSSPAEAPVQQVSDEREPRPNAGRARKTTNFAYRQLVSVDADLRQSVKFGSALDRYDPSRLHLRNEHKDTGVVTDHFYSAAFEIVDVESRGKDELYVLGLTGAGDSVIQRWKRDTVKSCVRRSDLIDHAATLMPSLKRVPWMSSARS